MSSMYTSQEISIRNAVADPVSSMLLEKLIDVIKQKHGIQSSDIIIEHTSIPNAKCELTMGVTIIISIASGVISAAIWDYIKIVYKRNCPPKNKKEWVLDINIEKPLHVSVKENNETGSISIEINEKSPN